MGSINNFKRLVVHLPKQNAVGKPGNVKYFKKPRFKPGAFGCDVRMLPLCCADPLKALRFVPSLGGFIKKIKPYLLYRTRADS